MIFYTKHRDDFTNTDLEEAQNKLFNYVFVFMLKKNYHIRNTFEVQTIFIKNYH